MSIIKILQNIWDYKWIVRSLPQTIYFNFHYLPFKQAKKLPILLYKPSLKKLKGTIEIIPKDGNVRFGMIELGKRFVSIFPSSGFVFENRGGTIRFYGICRLGTDSAISVGEYGNLSIGDNFLSTVGCKIIAYHSITIGECVRIGWNGMLMDTDFHKLKKADGRYSKGVAPIVIGNNCWLGNGCLVMKGTNLPNKIVVQARTVINKKIDAPECSIIGYVNHDPEVKVTGLWRDCYDDLIDYSSFSNK